MSLIVHRVFLCHENNLRRLAIDITLDVVTSRRCVEFVLVCWRRAAVAAVRARAEGVTHLDLRISRDASLNNIVILTISREKT